MDKIDDIKKQLRGEVEDKDGVKKLAYFDVKDGAEDGVPYYKTYLDQTTASMGALFKKTEWGELTPWEKLCCYKISGSAGVGVDCDAALRSTVIYRLAFGYGETYEVKRYKNKGEYRLEAQPQSNRLILRGDTMNSYAKTVREYIRKIWLPAHKSEMLDSGIIEKTGKNGGWEVSKKYQKISADNYWDAAILENYDCFKNILPEAADKFFCLYHTVGNFIPWPDGCNVPRGSGPVKDYWDLTLYRIYQWYQENKDLAMPKNDALLKLFGSQMVAFPNWLASFGSWDNFVRRNYMQDFVYGEDDKMDGKDVPEDGHFGLPKELWEGHFTNGVMPSDRAHFEQFFTNASVRIAARGECIARAVKAALAADFSAAREARP